MSPKTDFWRWHALGPKRKEEDAMYARAPRPGERRWAKTRHGATVLIEISSVELVFRTGWSVWGWRPGCQEKLPRYYFVPRNDDMPVPRNDNMSRDNEREDARAV